MIVSHSRRALCKAARLLCVLSAPAAHAVKAEGGGSGGGSAGTRYGAWLPASQQAGSGLGSSGVFGDLASAYDAARPAYPAQLFSDAKQLAPPGTRSADVGCGTGRGALAMARLGYDVVAVDCDRGMLQQVAASAAAAGVGDAVRCVEAAGEDTGLEAGSVQLATILQAFHWMDAPRTLREARRYLAPRGVLVLAWNDRCLETGWVCELEALIEKYNPHYDRHLKQYDPDAWTPVLTQPLGGGDLPGFELVAHRRYANDCSFDGADGLIAVLRTYSYVAKALSDEQAAALEADVRALVARVHGEGVPFVLPTVCKAYVLRAPA